MKSVVQPWWKVYSNDKEARYFKVLCRSKEYIWRSTKGIAKAAKLTIEEVEFISQKYEAMGLVHQHSKDPGKWGYFERINKSPKSSSISKENKEKRVKDAVKTSNP